MNSAETARAEVSENILIAQYFAVSNGLTFFIFEPILAYSFPHFERTSLPYNNNYPRLLSINSSPDHRHCSSKI